MTIREPKAKVCSSSFCYCFRNIFKKRTENLQTTSYTLIKGFSWQGNQEHLPLENLKREYCSQNSTVSTSFFLIAEIEIATYLNLLVWRTLSLKLGK